MIQTVLTLLPVVVAIMVGVNVVLGGIGQILHAIHLATAENVIGSISGWLKKLIDLAAGNIAH